ncbi:hypothetical protein [Aestuariibacter salexigens]|uniref:hypothetical protein n=1 Tax=Aestuariibacter salexigens TaxID=226010 RepID=UPI00047C0E73|nr:hypothetical protein [Aestuariibacter salexigens]
MPANVQSTIYRYLDLGNAAHTIEQLLYEPDSMIRNDEVIAGQGNLRFAALLLYMFEFDGFINCALQEKTGDDSAADEKLTLKERIKKLYELSNLSANVCGEAPFQNILNLFKLRDSLVHPKIEYSAFTDEQCDGPVSNEQLSEYLTTQLLQLGEPSSFAMHKKLLEDAKNKIVEECDVSSAHASYVTVSSG